jgi:hypothetical protein
MWGLLLCFPVASHAVDAGRSEQKLNIEVGAGLICNSAEQVERYLALHIADSAPEQAIKKVNDEVKDPTACALAAIAFVRGEQGKSIEAPGGIMKVTEVVILALQTPAGWQRVHPILQYTALFEKLEEV